MQKILRFVALPGEAPDLPSAWSALQTFGATQDYPRALEKLLLSISAGQEADAQTDPLSSSPVADLGTAPLPEIPAHGQDQDPSLMLFCQYLTGLYENKHREPRLPACPIRRRCLPLIDLQGFLCAYQRGQVWLSATLASALLWGVLLFSIL